MEVINTYVSSAANVGPSIAHWGRNNLICFGSCNAVLIYDVTIGGGKIIKSLHCNTKKIASVKWLSGQGVDFETEIVCGSIDGKVVVWSCNDINSFSNNNCNYKSTILVGHESNVNIIDGIYKTSDKNTAIVASASMDCTVRLWVRSTLCGEFIPAQCINFKYGISMAIKMAFLPYSNLLLLACGMENNKIKLYVEDSMSEDSSTKESISEKSNILNLIPSTSLSGHENWVRGMDFMETENGLLLSSASQDGFVRIWVITRQDTNSDHKLNSKKNRLMNSDFKIETSKINYSITLQSILTGHESWVYSANWSPDKNKIKLATASLDKTLIIWEVEPQTGLWLETVRLGEVGGNTLGFYGGMFGPTENTILGHSYHGAFHIWNYNVETGVWEPNVAVGGHFSEVVDLAWEPQGEFLVSLSTDQTTRVHAPWKKRTEGKAVITWHEIARPQVHGYDFSSIALLSRYEFVSSAEEKVIRAFEAPQNFRENFRRICKVQEEEDLFGSVPKGASVPSLGLSNKAVYSNDNLEQVLSLNSKEPYPEETHFSMMTLKEPPTEGTLIQNTLWPEIQKLYGHGYEVFCLSCTRNGKFVASACKSTSFEHAAIIIWDSTSWKQVTKLYSHTLTIVQLSFSPDSQSLLSVSRDRRWSVFKFDPAINNWALKATSDKKTGVHTRIIWTGAWSHDSKYFATGSRDGKVVVWSRNSVMSGDAKNCIGMYDPSALELKGQSVTAISFAPGLVLDAYLVAVGLESGVIHLYRWEGMVWTLQIAMDRSIAHHLDVKRLAFRPIIGRAGHQSNDTVLQLASCSSDFSVRVYDIVI